MTGRGMRILIAPDKFKGSLGAKEVAENIAAGLRENLSQAKIQILPIADGGEGTAEVICDALGGRWIDCGAHDPLGREINARYVWIEQRRLAVIEMSEAAGMRRMSQNERDPLQATTFGVGEIMREAAKRGAREMIVGLGGSATNDGGFGMARALGFRFLAGNERELRGAVSELRNLTRLEVSKDVVEALVPSAFLANRRSPRRVPLHLIAAADVQNPLLGDKGATRVFGPQKGVDPRQIEELEFALTKLADVVEKDLKCDYRNMPGAGAAGGLGFGLLSFCGAELRSGFDVVAEMIQLEESIRRADVVVTGEGSLDRQTLEGKAPAGVARLARRHKRRVFAIVGRSTRDDGVEGLFERVFSLSPNSLGESASMKRAAELLRERARELTKEL